MVAPPQAVTRPIIMDKRQGLNIGLLLLVAALGAVAWYAAERGSAPPAPPLIPLSPEEVHRVEISRPSSATLILTGQQDNWWVKEPVRVEANQFQVNSVLRVLGAQSLSQFSAAGKELGAYGLKEPVVRVRFNDVELAFGGMTPVDQRRYVLMNGTVHLITDSYFLDLTADVSEFVSRHLVPDARQIVALSAPEFSLRKGEDGRWQATPPDRFKSADAVQALLDAWQEAQAIRVEPYAASPSLGDVNIGFAGGSDAVQYLITARGDEWVLARPDIRLQFRITGEQMKRLLAPDHPGAGNGEGAAAAAQ